ncbi:class I SAM-dependent methyltransferase [Streptomyces mesophilus]|uniref:class I SAM-dependent methyltransferase n=1 Tax=Streptomyces mesophilus TaxID=1775132 RepID=UPI00331F0BB8
MVMAHAGHPAHTTLEIGAGTGKATRLFAEREVAVTATDPDGAVLCELRKQESANVRPLQAAFEDLRPGEHYRLIYAAAALHWTNPESHWSRMAALVEPSGVFASFGGPIQLGRVEMSSLDEAEGDDADGEQVGLRVEFSAADSLSACAS